ncbi:MAG: protein translocase subunit SecD [Planctomycetes bacterium]|nr:protein translocase subunit SecD [Planctomycetota bacterium]
MLRRLMVTSAIAALAIVLLFLQNKCSYFLGKQELLAEVKPVAEAAAPDAKQKRYEITFRDVAGNVIRPVSGDPELTEVKRRLAGNKELPPIATVGEPKRSELKIALTTDASVDEKALRERIQTLPFKRPNPPRGLFHITEGIDLRGGVEFICRLHRDDNSVVAADDEVITILRSRLDERGLTEPSVAKLSNGDIQIVIPGGTRADAARTRKVLETTGRLEFRKVLWPYRDRKDVEIVVDPASADPVVVERPGTKGLYDFTPGHSEVYRDRSDIVAPDRVAPGEKPAKFYRLGRAALVGSDISDAHGTTYNGQLAIAIEFTSVGAVKNEEFTKSVKEEGDASRGTGLLAIVFDGEVRSTARVIQPSSSSCMIHGSFTQEEIDSLRTVLRGGSLAVTPEVLSERVVGASLGEQTVNRTLLIRVVAFSAIVLFMWVYYRRLGTVANLCLVATAFFVWSTLSIFGATVTLPGLAGLVLIIGMAVDTNILIFERIREELREDKGMKAAIAAGYDRAFLTVLDSHLTTFITAFILYWIGSGPVKGFGLTLMIGIVVNLISGVYIGRMLTDWLCRNKTTLSMASWVPALRLPYVEWRWYGYVFSLVTGIAGLAWFAFGHFAVGGTFERNFDIDFTGGNAAQVVLKEPKSLDQVERALKDAHDRDPKAFNLLDPKELRKQAYFAELGGNQDQSREWVFRSRDEQGSQLERQRSVIERQRSALQRQAEDLRADKGAKDPAVLAIEQQLKPLDQSYKELSEQIGSRTEAFKQQIAVAFAGAIGQEGDEILAAAWDGTALSLTLSVLAPVTSDQCQGIVDRLSSRPELASVAVDYLAEQQAIRVNGAYRDKPAPRAAFDANDAVASRLGKLLDREGLPPGELSAEVTAATELYSAASNAAATRRVSVAKPFPSTEHFSGQVAGQMKWRAFFAILLSLLAILAYVAARFEFRFGIGAVLALVHDVALTIGIISVIGIRMDLSVVAALLTIIGYSINETIVNFDRIRENLRRHNLSLKETINLSLSQTLARTVLTSGTVVITLIALLMFGGEALVPFTATLLIGILSGTYSAIFVAAPLLLSFKGRVYIPPVDSDGDAGTPSPGSDGVVVPTA